MHNIIVILSCKFHNIIIIMSLLRIAIRVMCMQCATHGYANDNAAYTENQKIE